MESIERGLDRIFVYIVPLPDGVNEMVTPCLEGYTIYLSATLDDAQLIREYSHAVKHIDNGDFDEYSRDAAVGVREALAHYG